MGQRTLVKNPTSNEEVGFFIDKSIAYRHNQPPCQNKTADHAADNKIQCKQGNPAAHGAAARYKPEPHPMEAKRQPAEYPKPQIVNRSVLQTGRFKDAHQQGRSCHRYYALSEKLKDHFFSRHSISPPGIHYNSSKFRRR